MLRILTHPNCRSLVWAFALLCTAGALMAFPQQSTDAARQGLTLCANVIIPSLFPFFVLSSLVVELGLARYLGRALERFMAPLFRVGGVGASALVLGFVGGYPVGARTAIGLYEKGLCSKTETERLLAFCNNSGPAFILGVVGAGVFGSSAIGLLLYLTHMAASLCVGLLFRFYGRSEPIRSCTCSPRFQTVRFSSAFTQSITNAVSSVLNICAFVVLFTVLIRLLFLCGIMNLLAQLTTAALSPLGFDRLRAQQLLTGLLEMSSGVSSLSGSGPMAEQIPMAAFMLGWAGLSVHCQVLSFIADSDLRVDTYFVGKLLHGTLSALFTYLLARFFPLSQPVSSYLTQQVNSLTALDFERALTICTVSAWLMWLLFLTAAVCALGRRKKRCGKRHRSAV
ncbi:MAG: sporulation protein [Oscillospiraceae bacterium]|nr:sporulation protein [Oscillospiraceae bacterium]